MSDYRYIKAVRCKVALEKLGVESIFDLEDKFPDLFDMHLPNRFEKAVVEEEEYLDYILEDHISDDSGDWGRARLLSDSEATKYLALFSQVYPDVSKEDLRVVEFVWYDCSEAPLYFDEKDSFYDEI